MHFLCIGNDGCILAMSFFYVTWYVNSKNFYLQQSPAHVPIPNSNGLTGVSSGPTGGFDGPTRGSNGLTGGSNEPNEVSNSKEWKSQLKASKWR